MSADTITLAAEVSYNGAPFSGFARQPGQLTVQGELEHALELLFRREVDTTCAGRTDAGVHAKGQVVSFDVQDAELRGRSLQKLCRSMNALTHDDIIARTLVRAPLGFSVRFDAKSREYRYFISANAQLSDDLFVVNSSVPNVPVYTGGAGGGEMLASVEVQDSDEALTSNEVQRTDDTFDFAPEPPLYMRDFCWYVPCMLNVQAMREGATHLIGEHDFKSFCKAESAVGKPTHRCIHRIDIESVHLFDENLILITVVGNAFLHSMVRTIVGTLVAVGKGARKPDWVRDVLKACDRSAAGENAPAQGLTFWKVNY